jgi:hypothetical protein
MRMISARSHRSPPPDRWKIQMTAAISSAVQPAGRDDGRRLLGGRRLFLSDVPWHRLLDAAGQEHERNRERHGVDVEPAMGTVGEAGHVLLLGLGATL